MNKKYFLPVLCLSAVLCGVFYFYSKSESPLAKNHKENLLLLTQLKQTETELEKDTLRARNFLIPSYDPIVEGSQKLLNLCGRLTDLNKHYTTLSEQIRDYCDYLENKVQSVERFKSKNAILKNSLHYLQKAASDNNQVRNPYSALIKDLVNVSLSYSFTPSAEGKEDLQHFLGKANSLPETNSDAFENLKLTASHSASILLHRSELDSILKEVVQSDNGSSALEKLDSFYFSVYQQSEENAESYLQLLFVSSLLLILIVAYGVFRLIASARALARANNELEARVKTRTSELELEKKAMSRILSSMDQGLFTFDKSGVVGAETSKACLNLFSKNISGLSINEVLGETEKSEINDFIEVIFSNGAYNESFLDLFPSKVNINGKVLKLEYKPVIESGTLKAVLTIATDLTALIELENKTAAESAKNAALIKILSNRNDFIEAIEMVESLASANYNLNDFKRCLHTLKGSFSFLECRWLSEICHRWEGALKTEINIEKTDTYLELKTEIEKFVNENAKVLKINTEHQMIQISLVSLIDTLKHVSCYNPNPKVYDEFDKMLVVPLSEELQTLNDVFLKTASTLGKNADPILFDRNDKIPTRVYRNLFRSFIHIVRNAADHGISSYENDDSEQAGSMKIKLNETEFNYELHFQDNGKGVDIQKIKKELSKKGLSAQKTDFEIINSIFEDGLTTKEDVSEVSGRGVGLGVVRHEAQKIGGDCYAINEPLGGLKIVVRFPKLKFTDIIFNNRNRLVS